MNDWTLHSFVMYGIWFAAFAVLMAIPSVVTHILIYRRQRQMLETSPFFTSWVRLQSELADTLHHPHPEAREMDSLLEELEKVTTLGVSAITTEDRTRLTTLLRERMDDPGQTESERTRAELLLFAMRRVQQEAAVAPSN
jgi:hypothetical protein